MSYYNYSFCSPSNAIMMVENFTTSILILVPKQAQTDYTTSTANPAFLWLVGLQIVICYSYYADEADVKVRNIFIIWTSRMKININLINTLNIKRTTLNGTGKPPHPDNGSDAVLNQKKYLKDKHDSNQDMVSYRTKEITSDSQTKW